MAQLVGFGEDFDSLEGLSQQALGTRWQRQQRAVPGAELAQYAADDFLIA